MRQCQNLGAGIGIEPLPGFDRQLRADPVGTDFAQQAPLVAERHPGQVVFVADQHDQPAAPRLQRLAQRQDEVEHVAGAGVQRDDQFRILHGAHRGAPLGAAKQIEAGGGK